MKEHVDLAAARQAYSWTEQVYGNLGIGNRFRVSALNPESSLASQYLDLLKVTT